MTRSMSLQPCLTKLRTYRQPQSTTNVELRNGQELRPAEAATTMTKYSFGTLMAAVLAPVSCSDDQPTWSMGPVMGCEVVINTRFVVSNETKQIRIQAAT